jgi:pentapeptide MXKDX repeat protein
MPVFFCLDLYVCIRRCHNIGNTFNHLGTLYNRAACIFCILYLFDSRHLPKCSTHSSLFVPMVPIWHNGKMSCDKMSRDKMSRNKMSCNKMSCDKMSRNKMSNTIKATKCLATKCLLTKMSPQQNASF